jgi:prophage regulatory protein
MTTILRLPSVKARTGLSRSSIYSFVSRGEFPRPIALGSRAVGWNSEAVDAWITGRIEQSQLAGRARAAKLVEDVSPIVHESADMSDALPSRSRQVGRFSGPARHLRPSLTLGRSPAL